MLLKDAYLRTFNILESYYNNHKEDDAVISILSDMDTDIFQDGKPVDPATYDDWESIISPFVKNGVLEEKDVILALLEFLIYYQKEFGYELEGVIAYINNEFKMI